MAISVCCRGSAGPFASPPRLLLNPPKNNRSGACDMRQMRKIARGYYQAGTQIQGYERKGISGTGLRALLLAPSKKVKRQTTAR